MFLYTSAKAKVDDLWPDFVVKYDVFQFDVSVSDISLMEVLKGVC